jgi:cytochrome c556
MDKTNFKVGGRKAKLNEAEKQIWDERTEFENMQKRQKAAAAKIQVPKSSVSKK